MRRPPGDGTAHPTTLIPMRAYSTCKPGDYGLFLPTFYDRSNNGAPADPTVPYPAHGSAGDAVRVYDPFYLNAVFGGGVGEGEYAMVTWEPYRGIYIFAGSQGLTRRATLDSALTAGSMVSGTVFAQKPDTTTLGSFAADIYHFGSSSSDSLTGEVIVHYEPSSRKWITDAYRDAT